MFIKSGKIDVSFYCYAYPQAITILLHTNRRKEYTFQDIELYWERYEKGYGTLYFVDTYMDTTILDLDYEELKSFFRGYMNDFNINSKFLYREAFKRVEDYYNYQHEDTCRFNKYYTYDDYDDMYPNNDFDTRNLNNQKDTTPPFDLDDNLRY